MTVTHQKPPALPDEALCDAEQQPKPWLTIAPSSKNIRLVDLGANCCKWPSGSGSEALFCGAATEALESYCPYHAKISYVPRAERRRAAR